METALSTDIFVICSAAVITVFSISLYFSLCVTDMVRSIATHTIRIASISMTNGSFIGGVEIRGYVNQNGITVSCANKEIEGLYRTSDKIYFGIVTSISNIVIVSVNASDF